MTSKEQLLQNFEPYKRIVNGQIWYEIWEILSEDELLELCGIGGKA